MARILNGTAFRLRLGNSNITGETRSGLRFINNLVEVTTSPTNGYPEFVSGIKETYIDFENLYHFEPLEVGQTFEFNLGDNLSGWTGTCIIESIDISATSDDVITQSGVAKVFGELVKYDPFIEPFLLLESGDFTLQESGDKIIINVRQEPS